MDYYPVCLSLSVYIIHSAQNTGIYLDPKYGPDSISRIKCAVNLSTMSEFMKMDLFDYALPSWREVFDECPASSRNIYLYGARIYQAVIEREKNAERREGLIDTLMLIYERRIKNFGQEGLVSGRKGIDLLKYRPEAIQEAYGCLKKSVNLSAKNAEETILVTYMQTSVYLFRNGKIQEQEVIDNYLVISDILSQRILSGEKDQSGAALMKIETIFSESGAGSCTDLINIFTPRYNQDTADIELLKKITFILRKRGCQDSELFASASESLYAIEPSALAAFNLAILFAQKEDFIKSRKLALEAAGLRQGWGDPFILIGNLYASSSYICNKDELQQKAVFWIAVDQFINAKTIDTSLTDEANELINRYSQYFPNAEDAFFYGVQEGQGYTVGCWINEKTRVRVRKNQN